MTATEELRYSCAELERACALLMAPTAGALDGCTGVLEVAAQRLASLRPALHAAQGDPEALAEAWRLQRNVRRAGLLLANVSEYHARWNELMGVRTSGYRPDGQPGETPRASRLNLRG